MALSYFDVLPLHPRPKPLESLCSYIMRIAADNNIQSVFALSALFGTNAGTLARLSDLPLLSFGMIPTRTNMLLEDLLATTFYSLGKKFGRSAHPGSLARFLKGSLGSHLRYCPHCIFETGYYSLTWRFLCITGCPRHACRLLDCCQQCGEVIPLFTVYPHLGVCPNCHQALDIANSEALSEYEIQIARQYSNDFEYLLSWQECKKDINAAKAIGKKYKLLRQERHLDIEEISEHLHFPSKTLRGIENGNINVRVPFQAYLKYAEHLNRTLHTLFVSEIFLQRQQEVSYQEPSLTNNQFRQERYKQRERDLFNKVKIAISELQALNMPVTIKAVRHGSK